MMSNQLNLYLQISRGLTEIRQEQEAALRDLYLQLCPVLGQSLSTGTQKVVITQKDGISEIINSITKGNQAN